MKAWGYYTHFILKQRWLILRQGEDGFIGVSLEKGPRKFHCVGNENLHHDMGMVST